MPYHSTTTLNDHANPCNVCRGAKGSYEDEDRNGRIVRIWDPCWLCGGTGVKSVKIEERDA